MVVTRAKKQKRDAATAKRNRIRATTSREKQGTISFSFMDLPYDVRRMMYSEVLQSRQIYDTDALPIYIDGRKEFVGPKLPPMLNVCRTIRAEAFQAFVRGSIVDFGDFTDPRYDWDGKSAFRDGVPAEYHLENIKTYIEVNDLRFDFLWNIRKASVKGVVHDGQPLDYDYDWLSVECLGTEMIKRCPNLEELIIEASLWHCSQQHHYCPPFDQPRLRYPDWTCHYLPFKLYHPIKQITFRLQPADKEYQLAEFVDIYLEESVYLMQGEAKKEGYAGEIMIENVEEGWVKAEPWKDHPMYHS